MKFRSNEKGITLISLIITIIIILLLTAVSLSGAFGGGNIIERAQEAIYKSDVKDLKDLWESKIADIDASNINFDSLEDAIGESQVPREFRGVFAIENGKLVYLDGVVDAEKEQWMNDVGIFKMFMNMIQIDIMASVKSISQSEIIKTKPVDVVLVLDASTSMEENASDGKSRYKNLVPAVNDVMDVILSGNEENRVAVVQFAKDSTTLVPLGHYSVPEGQSYMSLTNGRTDEVAQFNSSISGAKKYTLKAGTGIMLGIARAEAIFQARTEAEKKDRLDYIILLSDGAPNYIRFDATYNMVSSLSTASGTGNFNMSSTNIYANKENSLNSAYHTIKWMETIKNNHSGLKFYTINFSDSVLSKAVMNPTTENITTLLSRSNNYVIATDASGTTYRNKENQYKELIKTVSPYAEASFSGEFDASALAEIFQQIGESILKDQIQETKIDTVEKATTLVIDESMRYKDEENNQEIIFKLDLGGEVKVRVTAGVFVPTGEKTEDDKIIREVDPTRTVKYEKTYSVVDIQNGIDPNLMISGGSVIWNVASDFSTKEELQSTAVRAKAINEAKSKFTYNEAADEAIDISKVEIVIPVYQDSVVPLGGE